MLEFEEQECTIPETALLSEAALAEWYQPEQDIAQQPVEKADFTQFRPNSV